MLTRRPLGEQPFPVQYLPSPTYLAVGLGLVGGVFFGKTIYDHAFRQGFTSEERKNLLQFAVASACIWGIQQVVDLDQLTAEWMAQAQAAVTGK